MGGKNWGDQFIWITQTEEVRKIKGQLIEKLHVTTEEFADPNIEERKRIAKSS
jgi:hypothetical protein